MKSKNNDGKVEIKRIGWGRINSSMWRISLQDWLCFTLLYLKAFCFKSAKRVIKISRSYGRLYALHIPYRATMKKESANNRSGKIEWRRGVAIDEFERPWKGWSGGKWLKREKEYKLVETRSMRLSMRLSMKLIMRMRGKRLQKSTYNVLHRTVRVHSMRGKGAAAGAVVWNTWDRT